MCRSVYQQASVYRGTPLSSYIFTAPTVDIKITLYLYRKPFRQMGGCQGDTTRIQLNTWPKGKHKGKTDNMKTYVYWSWSMPFVKLDFWWIHFWLSEKKKSVSLLQSWCTMASMDDFCHDPKVFIVPRGYNSVLRYVIEENSFILCTQCMYKMSKKSCPIVKIEYIMRIGEDFFGIQYYWVSKNLPQI